MDFEITEETTIREVLAVRPGAARIFMEFGMQCLGCPHSAGETLWEACAAHGANADELIHQLTEYMADTAG